MIHSLPFVEHCQTFSLMIQRMKRWETWKLRNGPGIRCDSTQVPQQQNSDHGCSRQQSDTLQYELESIPWHPGFPYHIEQWQSHWRRPNTDSIFKYDFWNLPLASPLRGPFPTSYSLMSNLLVFVGVTWVRRLMHLRVYRLSTFPPFPQLIYLPFFPPEAETNYGLSKSFSPSSLDREAHFWIHSCPI